MGREGGQVQIQVEITYASVRLTGPCQICGAPVEVFMNRADYEREFGSVAGRPAFQLFCPVHVQRA